MARRGEPGAQRSNGIRPGLKHFYRPTWTVPAWKEFVLGHIMGTAVQVCCGGSRIGIARIDVTLEAPGVNVLADAIHLPLKDSCADTVCCDPPYELPFDRRVAVQRELFRIARQRVIFKAPWIPRGRGWKLMKAVLLCSHTCQNVAVLSVIEALPEEANLF